MKPAMVPLLLAALALPAPAAAPTASAEPLRLRGEALATAESPVGLLTLSAESDRASWLTAEALVWTATRAGEGEGDALVIALAARDPEGRGELRLGRFVQVAGALRPLHLDGLAGLARLPWYRLQVEAFGGVPVRPRFGAEKHDWVAGARVSRAIGRFGSAGLAYMQRRERGRLDLEEVGADLMLAPYRSFDMSMRLAYDLIYTGVTEARAAAGLRRGPVRAELFAAHRSPSRLLPATSLFSVLGDVASQLTGMTLFWRAAPRLDLRGLAGVRFIGGTPGASGSLRSTLRLDDKGAGALSLELRRETAPEADWTGLRSAARVPLRPDLFAALEAELAVPDQARGRGSVWPWALVALRWVPEPAWEGALAFEASSSPEFSRRFDLLLRLARAWGAP